VDFLRLILLNAFIESPNIFMLLPKGKTASCLEDTAFFIRRIQIFKNITNYLDLKINYRA